MSDNSVIKSLSELTQLEEQRRAEERARVEAQAEEMRRKLQKQIDDDRAAWEAECRKEDERRQAEKERQAVVAAKAEAARQAELERARVEAETAQRIALLKAAAEVDHKVAEPKRSGHTALIITTLIVAMGLAVYATAHTAEPVVKEVPADTSALEAKVRDLESQLAAEKAKAKDAPSATPSVTPDKPMLIPLAQPQINLKKSKPNTKCPPGVPLCN